MSASGARLSALTKELWMNWQQVREYWQDSKAQEFETRFMAELFSSAEKTAVVIEQIDKAINKIKHDCE